MRYKPICSSFCTNAADGLTKEHTYTYTRKSTRTRTYAHTYAVYAQ